MKRLPLLLIALGIGLFVYGVLSFNPATGSYTEMVSGSRWPSNGYSYNLPARVEAAVGAAIFSLGIALNRNTTKRI